MQQIRKMIKMTYQCPTCRRGYRTEVTSRSIKQMRAPECLHCLGEQPLTIQRVRYFTEYAWGLGWRVTALKDDNNDYCSNLKMWHRRRRKARNVTRAYLHDMMSH